ncbi:MAG: transrane and tetratricopeptide repeat containing 3 [Patescibacteria group bacterium]|nr:transrane and tetratricopeptide repeat containing 3 [Patescibacteria group bacterium]
MAHKPKKFRQKTDAILASRSVTATTHELTDVRIIRSRWWQLRPPFWLAVAVIILVGFAVYFSGLSNDFVLDDARQIVNNPSIQSGTNWGQLFSGSTGYSGYVDGKLIGAYYRPLMMVSYSFIYSMFGQDQVAFHVIQLSLHIAVAVVLLMFLRYTFKPVLALGLALIFLAHPVNSQSVFYIASLQEPLYMLFGLLALWLLLKFDSKKSLVAVAVCLFVSLLAKESGILFVVMSAVYLFIYNRQRLYTFLVLMALPLVVYVALRTHALGLPHNPHLAQIDDLSIWGRLASMPAILFWYISVFFLPFQFAHAYYWTVPTLSITGFWLPLLADSLSIAALSYLTAVVKRRLPNAYYRTYLFFGIWFALGMMLVSQVFPLDLTVSPSWFYFPIIGLLGMLGIASMLIRWPRLPGYVPIIVISVIIGLLSMRTAVRGFDWVNDTTLAARDAKLSPDDYNAQFEIAHGLVLRGKFNEARPYAQRAVELYPTAVNYELLADICLWSGDIQSNRATIKSGLKHYPGHPALWLDLAIIDENSGLQDEAKDAIAQAYRLAHTSGMESYYTSIMNGEHINVSPVSN